MPKFHDEFFRGTTNRHDQLVVDTINQMDTIIRHYNDVFIEEKSEVSVRICIDREYCSSNSFIESEKRCSECEYVSKTAYGYSTAPPSYKSKTQTIQAIRNSKILNITTNIETEKIYSNPVTGFIIGYADIVVKSNVTVETTNLSRVGTWTRAVEHEFYLIIDAKPSLNSWGGPLRQIKTYMHQQRNESNSQVYGLITTYSTVSKQHKAIIENENVRIQTISRSKPVEEHDSG